MSQPLPVAFGALIIGTPLAAMTISGVMAWRNEIRARAEERDRLIRLVVHLKNENRQLRKENQT